MSTTVRDREAVVRRIVALLGVGVLALAACDVETGASPGQTDPEEVVSPFSPAPDEDFVLDQRPEPQPSTTLAVFTPEGAPGPASGTIALHDLDTGQRTVVADDADGGLTVSPGGDAVAYQRSAGGFDGDELVVAALDGGEPRVVATAPAIRMPVWSPTGERIAFSMVPEDGGQGTVIAWVDAAGGGQPQAATEPTDGVDHFFPSWAPDGRHVTYVEIDRDLAEEAGDAVPEASTVRWVDVEDGDGATVSEGLSAETRPAWSPDGEWIGFLASGRDEDERLGRQLYVAHPDTYGTEAVTASVGRGAALAWSPDAGRVALETLTGEPGVGRTDLQVVRVREGQVAWTVDAAGVDTDPAWSPTGDRIAFVGAPAPAEQDVPGTAYVVDADGSDVRAVTDVPVAEVAWVPGR